jgi:hypothetical protein
MTGADTFVDTDNKPDEYGAQSQEPRDLSLKKRPWRRRPTPWEDIINHEYEGAGTEEKPYIVRWLPDDGENPMRYPTLYKWIITVIGE